MKKKVYISGPMTGLFGRNYHAFDRAEAAFVQMGYDVLNPATTILPEREGRIESEEWAEFMQIDRQLVESCDLVVALTKGSYGSLGHWKSSRGACIEKEWALELGKEWKEV